jgi:hypothetical protein
MSLRPWPLATIRCTRKREKNPEGIALDCARVVAVYETAGPGSVGARETVRERIGSTLAITVTQAEARGMQKGA